MCNPSHCVHDILDGHSTTSYQASDPIITPGIQLPTTVNQDVVLEGEGSANWVMIAEAIDKYALVAETSKVKAVEPQSLAEARRHPDWELWEKGILKELGLLKEARMWELTTPPVDANIVGSKWFFCPKKDTAGNVVHYKASLVAQGFSQVPSVDYFDMFAPIAKTCFNLNSACIICCEGHGDSSDRHQGCILKWRTY